MAATHAKFYNVTQNVGPGQPNLRGDVMLVQFFLKEIGDFWQVLGPNPNGFAQTGFNLALLKPLKVDGNPDQNLYNWIKWFQSASSFGGTAAAQDGIVSHATAKYTNGKNSKVSYSITKMNNAFESFFPARWARLESDGKVPSALQQELERNHE